jgi:phosphoenolpyruvate carboxylase
VIPTDLRGFSPATREAIETFRVIRDALDGRHAGAVEAYIVSGTERASDLLEVLLLMKEAGLARAGGHDAALRIVPLFEAGATLEAAPATMDSLLRQRPYRVALRSAGDEQEVMIGYSDSNKDVGYVASSWAAYRAQLRTAAVLRRHGATWVFFHGRGGAVGRGGGPANVAILALPPGTVEGRLKMTEQGEMLAAKFGVSEIAHRELELAASATLVTTHNLGPRPAPGRSTDYVEVMEEMARCSSRVYRELVHEDPDFPAFFAAVTPVDEISRLRLGSRPARRRACDRHRGSARDPVGLLLDPGAHRPAGVVRAGQRAGGGPRGARARAAARDGGGLAVLRRPALQRGDGLREGRPGIARRYVDLWDAEGPRERIWRTICGELERTRAELTLVCGEERLLDREPVLQASIDRRNPYVDPLSYVQVALLRRLRAGDEDADGALGRLSLLTVNGIASGLRNT